MDNQNTIDFMIKFYHWFNEIADPNNAFSKEALQQYFAPNCLIEINDEIIARDYDSLFNHFEECRQSGYILQVELPLYEVFTDSSGQKLVARYDIHKISPINIKHNIEVIAIYHLGDDGRLARIIQVINEE